MFSVCMVYHDRPNDLRKSLAALAQYRPPDVEVVLIDNNSDPPDPIFDVWREFKDSIPISLVIRRTLPSPLAFASARNIALNVARKPWIVSLDADCVISPRYFQGVSEAIERFAYLGSRLVLAGERRFVASADVTLEAIVADPEALLAVPLVRSVSNHKLLRDKRMPEMQGLPDVQHPWDYMHGCNVIYSAELAQQSGGHDESFDGSFGYEDIEFAHRLVTQHQCSCHYLADMTVHHLEPAAGDRQPDRSERRTNHNWLEVCRRIPGYEDFKLRQYDRLGVWPRGLTSNP